MGTLIAFGVVAEALQPCLHLVDGDLSREWRYAQQNDEQDHDLKFVCKAIARELEREAARYGAEARPHELPVATAPAAASLPEQIEKPVRHRLKQPTDREIQVYRVRLVTGIAKQQELVEKMREQGVVIDQGGVSRALMKVEAWIKAGNILPDLSPPAERAKAVDPARLEMGKRSRATTPRQKPKKLPE